MGGRWTMTIPQKLAVNALLCMLVPTAVWFASRDVRLSIATVIPAITGAAVFTAMEPGYQDWSPSKWYGQYAKHLIDASYSLRSGRAHFVLRYLVLGTFLLIGAAVLAVVLLTLA